MSFLPQWSTSFTREDWKIGRFIKNANGNLNGGDKLESAAISWANEQLELISKGLPALLEPGALAALLNVLTQRNSIDDRKMLLEHIIMLMARLPAGHASQTKIQNAFVELLYNDLSHPAATYVSNQYAWRTADGSFNNVNLPNIGKSHTPYARSVQQVHPLPAHMLPDAGLLFDTLLKRDKFESHPAGLSSLMFKFAALVIHTVFRTSHTDWNINDTSSYVDLSPLYGVDLASQKNVRAFDGRGRLRPDIFAEDRLILFPPAVGVLLILFNRNHNYIAEKLLEINERGKWVDPETILHDAQDRDKKLEQQDEEIFQTTRLVNCGWFAMIVFSDYFSAILGFVRKGISWSLDPFEEIRKDDHTFVERGQGNVVSVEFNCLYRWHATTSAEDEEWTKTAFTQFFGDKDPSTLTPRDFAIQAEEFSKHKPDLENWTFGGLSRQADGKFADADLARILQDATAVPAGSFRARGIPEIMRLNEVMGIEQSRRWGVCSLNNFRKFLGLKPYSSFLEWNSNPEVAEVASKLYYGDINNLELYVGLQAEEAKPVVDGAGLCPGYTISRAILADAISLTRGDRFFTTDMTPYNYTSWGLRDIQRDTSNRGFGSMLGRLFLRTLPHHYASDSTYTWFPLMTPAAMLRYTQELGLKDRYDFGRPRQTEALRHIDDYAVIRSVLKDSKVFTLPYAHRFRKIVKGQGYSTVYDEIGEGVAHENDILDIVLKQLGPKENVSTVFRRSAEIHVAGESYFLSGNKIKNVNISSVLKAIPVYWVATEIAGFALITKENPNGKWTEQEFSDMLCTIFEFVFLDCNPAQELAREELVRRYTNDILDAFKSKLGIIKNGHFSIEGIVGAVLDIFNKDKRYENEFMTKLLATGRPIDELANNILSVMVASTAELSQAMINMVNMYLQPEFADERAVIERAVKGDPSAERLLPGLAAEAIRLDPPFSGVYRLAQATTTVGTINVKANEMLFLSIAKANRNATAFPNPINVDPSRPQSSYLTGNVASRLFGNEFVHAVMGQTLKTVFSLKNIRRAPGMSGTLKRFRFDNGGTEYYQYLDKNMDPTPWATSMILQYDA